MVRVVGPLVAPLSLTADTVGDAITQNPRYIRPLASGGDGSTDIDVLIETCVEKG
jgi:hypothetical protein